MNREDLAWAAAFLDGEGTFGVQKQFGRNNILYLQAGQIDRKVLDKLQSILNVGKVYGPYKQKRKNQQDYYYYRLTGNSKTEDAATLLWDWLSEVKKEQFGRAIRKLATETVLKTDEPNSLESSTLSPSA